MVQNKILILIYTEALQSIFPAWVGGTSSLPFGPQERTALTWKAGTSACTQGNIAAEGRAKGYQYLGDRERAVEKKTKKKINATERGASEEEKDKIKGDKF